jgi:hypothetical protein
LTFFAANIRAFEDDFGIWNRNGKATWLARIYGAYFEKDGIPRKRGLDARGGKNTNHVGNEK